MYNIWLNEGTGKCISIEDIKCLPLELQVKALSETIVFLLPASSSDTKNLLNLIERSDMFLRFIETETDKFDMFLESAKTKTIVKQNAKIRLENAREGTMPEAFRGIEVLCWIICKGNNLFNLYETFDEKPIRFYEAVHRIIRKEKSGEKFWKEVIINNILEDSEKPKENKAHRLKKFQDIIEVFQLPASDPRIAKALQNIS